MQATGVFVSTYKFVLNALPILLPEPTPPRAIPRMHLRSRSRSHLRSDGINFLEPSDSAFAEEDDEGGLEFLWVDEGLEVGPEVKEFGVEAMDVPDADHHSL